MSASHPDTQAASHAEPMKLSEAIRLGAMASGQAVGCTVSVNGDRCALGAALLAVGRSEDRCHVNVYDIWLYSGDDVTHPLTGKRAMLLSCVRSLNDDHRWTREQIADWVESIENAQTTPATSREEACAVALSAAPSVSAALSTPDKAEGREVSQ